MFIDHLYKFTSLSENIIFVILGRLSFPIFAFCVAQGAFYTSNKCRYMLRMFLFAILSEIPFDLMIYGSITMRQQNIMWTFLLALMSIFLADYVKEKFGPYGRAGFVWHLFFGLLFGMAAIIYNTDYHCVGVFTVVILYVIKKIGISESMQKYGSLVSVAIANILLVVLGGGAGQLYGILALVLLWFYDGTKGKKSIGKLFYIAYPMHMLLIFAARYTLSLLN